MDTPASHLERIARDGTPSSSESSSRAALGPGADLQRLKEEFDVRPARNPFEGAHHRAHLQPARAREALRADSRPRRGCSRSSRASSIRNAWSRPGWNAPLIRAPDELLGDCAETPI